MSLISFLLIKPTPDHVSEFVKLTVTFTKYSISWICTKLVPDNSPDDQMLHFLLDHPRRYVRVTYEGERFDQQSLNRSCFIYLFPSHVTWFLAAALGFFTYVGFLASFDVETKILSLKHHRMGILHRSGYRPICDKQPFSGSKGSRWFLPVVRYSCIRIRDCLIVVIGPSFPVRCTTSVSTLLTLIPSTRFLCVIMMYIAVYPVSLLL